MSKLINKNKNNNNNPQEHPSRARLPAKSNRGRDLSRGFYQRRRNFPRANTATSVTENNIDTINQQFYEEDDDCAYDDAEVLNLAAGKIVPGFMALSITSNSVCSGWFLDLGATRHMFSQRQMFACLRRSSIEKIRVAGKGLMDVKGVGDIYLQSKVFGTIILKNVLFIPNVTANSICVSCIEVLSCSKMGDIKYTHLKLIKSS